VAFLLFSLCIAIERALVGQVLSIRYASADEDRIRRAAARGMGTILLFGLGSGAVVGAAGLVLGGDLRGPLLAVGITMAALLLQDTCRMIFFAQSRSHLAALNDGVWAVVQFSSMGVALALGRTDPGLLTFLWGASSAVCVVLAMVQLRAVPDPRAAPGWIREHRDLLGYLLPETLVTSGGDKAAYLMVGGILSAAAVGAVNAARQLLNPLLIISQAAASFAMPEISRRSQLSEKARWQAGVGLGAVVGAASLVYVGLVLLVPDAVGVQLFGATWKQARQVLLPMGLFSAAAGMCLGPFVVIAAMGHARRTFRVTVLQTVLMLILMPLGAVLGDVTGATWGLFIGKVIELPFWLRALRTASAEGPVGHIDAESGEGAATGPAEGSTAGNG
jgi:O-antigen/teichoic acid export membrane protein